MSSDPPSSPLKHLWNTAQVAAVIVTLIGFTPDNWVARLLRAANLESLSASLPDADYRLLLVGLGVSIFAGDVVIRNRRGRKQTPVSAVPAPLIADLDESAGKPSIAVLPFVNMSDDKSQEYFADGITEDIITGLSCDSRLNVTARNSTFAYKGLSPDIRTVGKELGVRYVLEGSIRPIGDRLRITVQLIDTASGNHVWADKIDRPAADIFDIMDEVVDGLVMVLCSNLGVAESKRAQRQRPEDLHAWALCVQAEVLCFLVPSTESVIAAEKLLRRATEIEPGYGAGWGFLAFVIALRQFFSLSANHVMDADEAVTLANKALSLAPNDPTVLGYSGIATILAGETAQAVDCLEHALEINPNNSLFRLYYGFALVCNRRPEAGIVQFEHFFRLSPRDQNAGLAYYHWSWCYLALDDFHQAEQTMRKSVKLMPGFVWGYYNLALSLAGLGRAAEAQQQIQKVHQMAPALKRQEIEESWRRMFRKPEDAEKFIALAHLAWRD